MDNDSHRLAYPFHWSSLYKGLEAQILLKRLKAFRNCLEPRGTVPDLDEHPLRWYGTRNGSIMLQDIANKVPPKGLVHSVVGGREEHLRGLAAICC